MDGVAPNTEENVTKVVIPYVPRTHFRPMHASHKRWKFVVAHRRAGKTVALCNETIKAALQNTRVFPPPRYAYIGPSFAQTKDLVWGYFKHYTQPLPDIKVSEGDMQITLPNGAMINLYGGAAAYERMRGLYFDGAVADEYPLLNPSMLGQVLRPCLADYRGWGVISGTSNGDDHFNSLRKRALADTDDWDIFSIPVSETNALDQDEVEQMRKDMTPEEFDREMMCSFDAPMEGAYYADIMNELEFTGHITGVPYDAAAACFTWWDLGIDDEMVIWICQLVGREIHIIDYIAGVGKGLEHYAAALKAKPYYYAMHVLPHDVKARELGTGKSRYEILEALINDIFICPFHRVEDGIAAVRSILRMCYFDKTKTAPGILGLRNYHKSKKGVPVHNWASHPSDAFRVGAVALNHIRALLRGAGGGNVVPLTGALKRNLKRTRT
jgi:phage terminase large subunit